MSKPSVTKKVAPNLCFLSSGRATVKCDLLASSNVSTTSLSGIGSRAGQVRARRMARIIRWLRGGGRAVGLSLDTTADNDTDRTGGSLPDPKQLDNRAS